MVNKIGLFTLFTFVIILNQIFQLFLVTNNSCRYFNVDTPVICRKLYTLNKFCSRIHPLAKTLTCHIVLYNGVCPEFN